LQILTKLWTYWDKVYTGVASFNNDLTFKLQPHVSLKRAAEFVSPLIWEVWMYYTRR